MKITLSLLGSALGKVAVVGRHDGAAWAVELRHPETNSLLPSEVCTAGEWIEIRRRLDVARTAMLATRSPDGHMGATSE